MTLTTLPEDADLRRPEYRREVFLRFYDYHTKYGTHPGLVYLIIPSLAEKLGWTTEETLWFSFLNGCTQHPITTLRLWREAPSIDDADRLVAWLEENVDSIVVDTDRRYHRRAIPKAIHGYRTLLNGSLQEDFWRSTASEGWSATWTAARAIPTFGRLSAWSFCDYLLCSGVAVSPNDLMLEDRAGSRSHRNGLSIVSGRDDLDHHASNPTFDGRYTGEDLEYLAQVGDDLLLEAQTRATGQPYARFVNRLTLESALCTYKSFHRPNRRYPNVYADMNYDRIVGSRGVATDADLDLFWEIRAERLPVELRLEDNLGDPGCVALKQNWYRETGRLPMMSGEYADMKCEFDDLVRTNSFGVFR